MIRPTARRPLLALDQPLLDWLAALAMTLFCSINAHASNDDALRLFQAGRSAFEAQDYTSALEAFEAAAAAKLPGPAVHFNIGVAAFRLGLYARAEAAFTEVARTPPMAALALYNLGLVALRRSDPDTARHWFARVMRESVDERLRELASTQLAELAPQASRPDWLGYAAMATGYDDNVALISDSGVLGVSRTEDAFLDLQLAVTAPLGRPWRLDAGVVFVDYQELDRFDQLGAQGGVRYQWEMGTWAHEVATELSHTTLDGESFESRRMLALETRAALNPEWHLRARYRFSDIDGLNEFDAVSGQRHEAGVRGIWARQPWRIDVGYQFAIGDHTDDQLSASRHRIGFKLQRALGGAWQVELEANRRHSRYDVTSSGTEDLTELALAMTRMLTQRWHLVVRYAYADNDADLAEFNYERNRIAVGVESR